jgi:hypothetical protein
VFKPALTQQEFLLSEAATVEGSVLSATEAHFRERR